MSVTYTREQRQRADSDGLVLITVDVPGLSFQGPVTSDDRDSLLKWLTELFDRRREARLVENRTIEKLRRRPGETDIRR